MVVKGLNDKRDEKDIYDANIFFLWYFVFSKEFVYLNEELVIT